MHMSKILMTAIAFATVVLVGGGCKHVYNVPIDSTTDVVEKTVTTDPAQVIEPVASQKTQNMAKKSVADTQVKIEKSDTSKNMLPDSDVGAIGDVGWKQASDPYLGISFSYPQFYTYTPANFTAHDDIGYLWMTLKRVFKDEKHVRIEVWKLRDISERPFGFTGEEDPDSLGVILPTYQELVLNGETYGVFMFLNGMDDFEPEMQAIIDTIE